MVKLHIIRMGLSVCLAAMSVAAQETVSVTDAIGKAEDASYALQALEQDVKAAEALVEQAGARPNPGAEIELEDCGMAEMGIMVSQPIELGGKRAGRVAVAQAEVKLVGAAYEAAARKLRAEVLRRCIRLAANTGHAALLDSALIRAERTVILLRKRADAGAAAAVDVMRAGLEEEEILLEKMAVERQDVVLRNALAAQWRGSADEFGGIRGRLNPDMALPSGNAVATALGSHPEVKMNAVAESLTAAEKVLSERNAMPDLELGAGYVRNNELKENSFILAAGMELPLFNRNKGETAAREYAAAARKLETAATELSLHTRLTVLTGEIGAIDAQLKRISDNVLPQAASVFTQLSEYYDAGTVSLLEVLEAQGALLKLKLRSLQLITGRALLYADLAELTGLSFDIILE